jgi:hypothetical protein
VLTLVSKCWGPWSHNLIRLFVGVILVKGDTSIVLSLILSLIFMLITNQLVPLPNSIFLVPLFFLQSLAFSGFLGNLDVTVHYFRHNHSEAMARCLLVEALLAYGIVIIGWGSHFFQISSYITLFFVLSVIMRTSFETTRLQFDEDINVIAKYFRGYAATRLASLLAIPILIGFFTATEFGDIVFISIIFSPVLYIYLFRVPFFNNRGLLSYGLGRRDAILEYRIIQKLEKRPQSLNQLANRLREPKTDVQGVLLDLHKAMLVQKGARKWELGRSYLGVLKLFPKKVPERE